MEPLAEDRPSARGRRPVSRPTSSCAVLAACVTLALAAIATPLAAQATGSLTGRVLAAEAGRPLSGVTVRVRGSDRGALSGEKGRFVVQGVPAGTHTVEISLIGYRTAVRTVDVPAGRAVEIDVSLRRRPVEVGGIEVAVLRPDLQPRAELGERELRRANPKDAGQLLRGLAGMDAVRRGALGLDPVVRGLRETEVGTYLDGTRLFPAGPARMDSPLTHLDPSAVSDIQVVKGPYALTWGAGNMSAIRVETEDLPLRGVETVRGSVSAGYDMNLAASETHGTVSARRGRLAIWGHGAWRQGDDYESGNGTEIPADFESWEGRGKLGVDVGEASRIVFSGGHQDQGPIDYPGRLLTAELFDAINLSARWRTERSRGLLRDLDLLVYRNGVDHQMSNRGKPTAEPMEGRMPPFALDVGVRSEIDVWGGRAAAELARGPWSFRVGGDLYSANRDAVRTIRRESDGTLLFQDLMWPDATITDAGLFARAGRTLASGVRLAGTVRVDLVRADADTISDFFRENVSTDLDRAETNWSGAVTLGFPVADHWDLSLGAGSVVRTADATERYSDRIPATKAQTSAEFVGDPALDPERSTQADVWLEGRFPKLSVQLNAFARRIDDYITLESTALPKRLPLSPETVFRYVNGSATFWGAEASAAYGITSTVTAETRLSWLRGQDETVDEPALGVAPLSGGITVRHEERRGRYFVEGGLNAVSSQDRVAATRGEEPTDAYATLDLRAGWAPGGGVNLRLGVENLLDEQYVNHLNAKNPFAATAEEARIPEPGRVIFLDVSYAF